ncbi:MAG TPA: hypothetical protein PKN61_10370 [Acidobacteriota bacterium]|jgi:hypothetical protein|nr:hypothetical protein [Acidobacteriota bacterium]HNR39431.1 hypothetical protein [Acidobacteriota bacterium]HNU00819.1 hypothetical protein [Acidobacteriota bacterium]HPB26914.1 hypothetical protein [Acidobacteriota bacterium]HQO24761.1 hypothetical protein [Acidobacteriota bacterium]
MADEHDGLPESSADLGAGRRRLLRTLVAAGGAAAALKVLPREWTRPVVEMVELPVHAQGSLDMILLTNLRILTPPKRAGEQPLFDRMAAFDYEDPASGVTDSASLYVSVSPCGELIFNGTPISGVPGAFRSGTASVGNVSFPFSFNCSIINSTMSVRMGVGSRNSNELIGYLFDLPT